MYMRAKFLKNYIACQDKRTILVIINNEWNLHFVPLFVPLRLFQSELNILQNKKPLY